VDQKHERAGFRQRRFGKGDIEHKNHVPSRRSIQST
jgi:hypothetical protein